MIHLLRGPSERAARPFTNFLIRHRFTASLLTIIAFLGTVLASALVYYEIWKLGAFLFLVFSLFDALDGLVARSIFYGFRVENKSIFVLALLALIISLITSYIKAKAENFLEFGSIGLLQRPERILIIFLMLLFPHYLILGLWILVIGGFITIVQRLYSAYQKFNRRSFS